MDAEQAIQAFWSSFGLSAYDENSVPDGASLPYITYSLSYDSFDNNVTMAASIWYRSSSWATPTYKAQEVVETIKAGGVILKTDRGGIWIKPGNPIYQRINNDDTSIKRIYINITAEYIEP